ncbi:hypothetical protein [Serratia rubidaea]|nr:hypothetical protein [Serratia rubidaea]
MATVAVEGDGGQLVFGVVLKTLFNAEYSGCGGRLLYSRCQ